MSKVSKIPKKYLLGLGFLASCTACLDEPSRPMSSMCPSDGANLFLKCADGREQVFGLGYKDVPFYVREKGKWTIKAAEDFCTGEPAEIGFHFRNGQLRVSGQKVNGKWSSIWRSAYSDCIPFEHKIGSDSITLKLDSIPLNSLKPEDEPG